MNWVVEIQKTSLDLRSLADLLGGLGFSLVDGIEFPAFTSPSIDRCTTAEEVFEQAKRLRAAFTGAAQIDMEFSLGVVIDYSSDSPQQKHILEPQSIESTVDFGHPSLTVSPPDNLSGQALEDWIAEQAEKEYQAKLESQRSSLEPAFWSGRALKVQELLNIEHPSGEEVYKIYELAEGHPSNRHAFHAQFGISTDQFKRFGDAVHNPRVSGDWARHGYDGPPKTDNPMSKDEAERFVRHIATQWLAYVRTNKSD